LFDAGFFVEETESRERFKTQRKKKGKWAASNSENMKKNRSNPQKRI
jgi:hypothetical protein